MPMLAVAPSSAPETRTPVARGATPPPLLPPLLSGPASLLWLWVLPVFVLLLLNGQGYWLVEGNLDIAQRERALVLGGVNVANLLIGLGLYVVGRIQMARGERVFTARLLGGLPAVATQVAYLWFAVASGEEILPRSVTAWIYPETRFLFNQFAFAMLPLFLGVLQLATAPIAQAGRAIAVSLGLAIVGPVLLYFGSRVLWIGDGVRQLPAFLVAGVVVLCGVLLFVGLVRGLLLGLRSAGALGAAGERWAIALFALAMPLAGLALNTTIPFPVDFQAIEVYALVLANTAILTVASFQHARRPVLSFGLLCATLPFSLYFFIVFLPYTPLSILAVLAMGAGFLVLTPTVLFTLHLHLLYQAQRSLRAGAMRRRGVVVGVGCLLILPGFFVARGLADRVALHSALDHVFAPAVNRDEISYPWSRTNLRRALANHRSYKNGIYYPLLSDFYSWVVFDNLVLSDDKLARVETAFFGEAGSKLNTDPLRNRDASPRAASVRERSRQRRAAPVPRTVEVSGMETRIATAGPRNTTVTLTLNLLNTGSAQAEYATSLPLPAGVFVNGFRLHINGVAVPGRITEKKTALWVYTTIRDLERRDPGLLFYNSPEELELRVFPIEARARATVEIDFLLPVEVEADAIAVGRSADAPRPAKIPGDVVARWERLLRPQLGATSQATVLAGGIDRANLPRVKREPYLHVIVDRSQTNGFVGDVAAAIAAARQRFPEARMGRVALANYEVVSAVSELTPLSELAARIAPVLSAARNSGGLSLDLALAHGLRQHAQRDLDGNGAERDAIAPRPVFVVLSRSAGARSIDLGIAEAWLDLVPGLELHEIGADGSFASHRSDAREAPLLRLGASRRPLLANRAVRFSSTSPAAVEYWSPEEAAWKQIPGVEEQPGNTAWSRAAALHLQQQDATRSPGDAGLDRRALVAASRETGVMIASTSYIVVENAAQWRMLEVSEQRKLGQNDALDFVETPAPAAVWVAGGFVLWFAVRRWRAKQARC